MRKKGVGKRILSALLTFALVVTSVPAGQLVAFAAPAVDETTTKENVAKVQSHAQTLLENNANKDSYASGSFTWNSTNSQAGWTYYNGMMLDAYTMLGSNISSKKDTYFDFVKAFYDKGNLNDDGALLTYVNKELGSVPMGLALFDLIGASSNDESTTLTEEEIAALEETPFEVDTRLFDQTLKNEDFKLTNLEEKNIADDNQVYNASVLENNGSNELFVNGVVMTEFNGNLYCQWQTSIVDEDDPVNTRVVYSVSTDNGGSWSAPIELAKATTGETGGFYSSGGWYVNDNNTPSDTTDDTLVAYLNYWPNETGDTKRDGYANLYKDEQPPYKYGYTRYRSFTATSTDGVADNASDWSSDIADVLMNDGSAMRAIFEQDPHVLDSGRIVNAAHFASDTATDVTEGGLFVNPIFTDDKSGVTGWMKSDFTMLEDGKTTSQSRELEPSMFINEDGHLVMIFRDQKGTNQVLASVSTDQGVTWSEAAMTNMPDAQQKQSAGNLPDGTAYIVNCPVSVKTLDTDGKERVYRYPLTISLSKDGKNFNKAYIIGSAKDVESNVHSGYAKRTGYHYPKSVVIGDYLYVAYARNKEIAEYVKIPLSAISLNGGSATSTANTNENLITLSDNTTWELDYDLQAGDRIFTDRPSSSGNNATYSDSDKYFASNDAQSSDIPEELIGSVYIRTANADKSKPVNTPLAKIKANQAMTLYIGIDNDLTTPFDWVSNAGFSLVKDLTYMATYGTNGTDGLIYNFYKKDLKTDEEVTFYGAGGSGTWNYIAMAVPVDNTPYEKYRTAIKNIYSNLTNSGYYTKLTSFGGDYNESDSTITLADVYMAQRFLIECANAITNEKLTIDGISATDIYADVYNSLMYIGDNLYDSSTYLYSNGYDATSGAKSGVYQAREVGFYAMTLVDTIAMLPDSESEKKAALTAILKQLFDGMIKYQDTTDTGLWREDIISSSNMNFEGSSMMSYALLKAYDEGILIDGKYGNAGVMAFNGVVKYKLDAATLSASEDSDEETYATCIAPLMMASVYAEGVSDYLENGTDDVYVDLDTGIKVSGVANANISAMTKEELASLDIYITNSEGYHIELDNYSDVGATIKIPTDSTAQDLSVYLIKDGKYIPISGTVDKDGYFVFTITEGGNYVLGSEVSWNELAWRYVSESDEYDVVYEMVKDGATEYVITQPGTADGIKYTLGYSDTLDKHYTSNYTQASINSELKSVEGKYTLSNISSNNTWRMDAEGRIYCVVNGEEYYLMETEYADFSADSEYYVGEPTIYTANADGSGTQYKVYSSSKGLAQYNPEIEGSYVTTTNTSGATWAYAPDGASAYLIPAASMYEEYSDADNEGSLISEATVKGSLALYASCSANFIEDNGKFTAVAGQQVDEKYQSDNNFFYWAKKNVGDNPTSFQGKEGATVVNTQSGSWHSVAVVVKNDSVTYYVDNNLVPNNSLLNYKGESFDSGAVSAGGSFNYGYGYAGLYKTTTPEYYNQFGVSVLDFVSDENTVLSIGGVPYSVAYASVAEQDTDTGVRIDDLKFYDIALTSSQISGGEDISKLPIASYTFDEGYGDLTDAKIEADSGNNYLTFSGKAGCVEIANPYSGRNLSEDLSLNDSGYPEWSKGITMTYRVYVPETTSDAPLLVFNNDQRVVMSQNDAHHYTYCELYDVEANAVGKDLILTTKPEEAIKWSTRRGLTGTEVSAISAYSGEVIYLRASAIEGGHFQVTSESTTVALWSKVLTVDEDNNTIVAQAYTGDQVALTGTLNYDEIVGSSLNVETIKANAMIYYRESEDAVPVPVALTDTNHVECIWESGNTLDTSSAGTYTMIVKYDGHEIGSITVNVTDLTWKGVSDGTSFVYERVQEMDPENKNGYVITSAHISMSERNADDALVLAGRPATYKSLAWRADGTYSVTKDVEITKNTDGSYNITNVNDENIWFIDKEHHIFSEDKTNKNYYYLQSDNATIKPNAYYYEYKYTSNLSLAQFLKVSSDSSETSADKGKWSVKAWTREEFLIPEAAVIYNYDATTALHTNIHLRVNLGSDPIVFATKAKAEKDGLYIYEKRPVANVFFALGGKNEYTEYVGVSTLTEAQVYANSPIYKKDSTGTIQAINWSDTAVSYEWTATDLDGNTLADVKALDTSTAGIYTLTVKYNGEVIGTKVVKVLAESSQGELVGNGITINTSLGKTPDFSSLELSVTYSDSTIKKYNITNGLVVDGSAYDITKPGTYENVAVKFNGVQVGTVTVKVSDSPYEGVTKTPDNMYPTYPEEGSVRIRKTASEDLSADHEWYDTGVTKVELNVAGTSVKGGVDVVLITDVSNSMGRRADEVTNTGMVGKKLYDAMQASSKFADILLADNDENEATNNSLSFVTFASFDAQNAAPDSSGNDAKRVDSVQTVFTNVQDVNAAKKAFDNTKFIDYANDNADFMNQYGNDCALQIGRENGITEVGGGRGGTNYDYAFAEAKKAVEQLHASYTDYSATGRKTIVLFMTDGAPTYYNNERVDGDTSDYLYGSTALYPKSSKYKELAIAERGPVWLDHVSAPNVYAVELADMVDEIYSVGFKLESDIGEHTTGWKRPSQVSEGEESDFEKVLGGLAGIDEYGQNKVKDVLLAEDSEELITSYEEIARSIAYSGTYAEVEDVVKSDFTLAMGSSIRNLKGDLINVAPQIQIIKHELYTKANCNGNEALIGTRTGNKTVLETVSFTEGSVSKGTGENGTDVINISSATSVALVNGVEVTDSNCYSNNDGVITITGEYFTYTKDVDGVETFNWNIGTIDDSEVALSYYAYLKGTAEGTRPDGTYDTNESARLDYIDMNGYHAHKDFKSPNRPWGSAITTVEYYLVNEKGVPIDSTGKEVSFAQRQVIEGANQVIPVPWNTTTSAISGSSYLPALGYAMYNPKASYSVSVDATNFGNLVVSDNVPISGSLTESTTYWTNNAWETFSNDTLDGEYKVGATRVAFAVYENTQKKADPPLGIDRVVMDFGKAIQVDVFSNNPGLQSGSEYTGQVVGFHYYYDDPNYIKYEQLSAGDTELDTSFGTFSLVDGSTSKVQYTLNKMLTDVERVFTVVEVTKVGSSEHYYLYQELDIIPATNMYYETDFVEYYDKIYETSYSDVAFSLIQTGNCDWTEAGKTNFNNLSEDKWDCNHEPWGHGNYICPNEKWVNFDDWSGNSPTDDNVQDDGTIGKYQTYGYDSTYSQDVRLSDGTAYKVNGQVTSMNDRNNTYASFTFKGTGFDIISRTGTYQGMIRVEVYDPSSSTPDKAIKVMSVLNKSESNWELYQIPVISIDMNKVIKNSETKEVYGHGEYFVKIIVMDEYYFNDTTGINDYPLNRGNEFYFDAVRIYNPVDVSKTTYVSSEYLDGKVNEAWNVDELVNIAETYSNEVITLNAYAEDGEASPKTYEVRDLLIEAEDMDLSDTSKVGVLYVDKYKGDGGKFDIVTYENIGPNNEVYITTGKAIAFELIVDDISNLASIDIGIKSVEGNQIVVNTKMGQAFGSGTLSYKQINTSSSTAQYYDINPNQLSFSDTNTADDIEDGLFKSFKDGMGTEDTSDDVTKYKTCIYIECTTESVASITDLKVAFDEPSTSVAMMAYSLELSSFIDLCAYEAPDYSVQSAAFSTEQCKIFSNVELLAETTQDVESIQITNTFGQKVKADVSYVDTEDGTRIWSATMIMSKLGTHKYTVTGYGADGTAGEPKTVSIRVNKNEGGGWQNAKSIYKTLFNCRILSIKRGNGSRMWH